MADTHRRVEPRGIVGTGMLNDPDRLRDIENRYNRFMRDRDLPRRKFGEVMDQPEQPDGDQAAAEEGEHQDDGVEQPPRAPEGMEWVNAPPAERRRKLQRAGAVERKPDTRFGPRPAPKTARPRPEPAPAPAPATPGQPPQKGTTRKPPPGMKV